MKNTLALCLLIILMIWMAGCAKNDNSEPGNDTPPSETPTTKVYKGELNEPSIAELQQFQDSGYTKILYNITLSHTTGLKDLSYLSNLDTIMGSLYILENADLTSLKGADKLKYIGGDLFISINFSLTTINSFNSLLVIQRDFSIFDNDEMETINGFKSLHTVNGKFRIEANSKLTSVESFDKLTYIAKDFSISSNSLLTSIASFSNLEDISNGKASISSNQELTDFCPLTKFINNKTTIYWFASGNGYNPSLEDMKDGNCSP